MIEFILSFRSIAGLQKGAALFSARKSDGESVSVELEDEGWKPYTGAINFISDETQLVVEAFHFPKDSLLAMDPLLDTSKGHGEGVVPVYRVGKNGRIAEETENIQVLRRNEGAVLSSGSGSKYTIDADVARLLRNQCCHLVSKGWLEDSDKSVEELARG